MSDAAEKPSGLFGKPRAVLIGLTGLFAGILSFTDKGKEVLFGTVNILPAEIAQRIPFSAAAEENGRVDYILTNRYVNPDIVEKAFGKPTAERSLEIDGKRKVVSAYFGSPGSIYIERYEGSIDCLIFIPERPFDNIEQEISNIKIVRPYNLKNLKEARPEDKYVILEVPGTDKSTAVGLMSISIYNSYQSFVAFSYNGLLDCNLGSWGIGGGDELSGIPCKKIDVDGRIKVLIILREYTDMGSGFEVMMNFYNKVMDRAFQTSPIFQRKLFKP